MVEKIVIYTSDYMGHVMETLGIAEYLKGEGYEIIFSFITFPKKEAYNCLVSKGFKIDVSKTYLSVAIKTNNYDELMKAIVDCVGEVLLKYKPKVVICDADHVVPLVCRKMGIISASLKRTNIPAPIAYKKDFQEGVLRNGLINHKEVKILSELIDGDIQLVPHSEFFFKINSRNPYYYCPKLSEEIHDISLADQCDILCVLSTAYDMDIYKNVLVETFKIEKYKVLICYPQATADLVVGNVRITRWVDVDKVIMKTKVVISTGGHGIMTKAILNRKLQIVLEVKELFAVYYGNKIKEHMLGIYLQINSISKESIMDAIHELFLSDVYQMHVDFMSLTIRNLGGLDIQSLLDYKR